MKCKICGNKFKVSYFLQKVCNNEDCKIDWAISVVKKNKEKQAKEKKQLWNKEKLEIKERLMTLSDWKNNLQKEINLLVRTIDKKYPCIATGSFKGQFHAGHYISIGSNETLRFHLENIWSQSMHSNSWKSGDTLRYQQGIIENFGKDYLEYITSLQEIKPIKLTIEDIKEKIPIVRGQIKWCILQDRKFTKEERISLRKKFNNEIGIYGN